MDSNIVLIPLANILAPILGVLAISLPVVGIYIAKRFFALRTRELELESEHHARELVARVTALELRQGAVEKAVVSLSGVRTELLEPPPAQQEQLSAPVPLRQRDR